MCVLWPAAAPLRPDSYAALINPSPVNHPGCGAYHQVMPRLPRIRALTAALAVLVVALGATAVDAGVAGAAKKKHHVTIKGTESTGYSFKPQTITIHKGQKVHWSWSSDAPHNVTFDNGKHSATASSVTDYTRKFKKKGTFTYVCTVHGFSGKVVVKK